ncbi:hypothetical protein CISIN_1g040201mg [Citrus sinensis]|uniref:Uncharacterized protein n=1 Tax=Citrus sinensis TaxID=2711 RepID=A0A067G5M0_CITSI|nr:hypothetical protein CISIN_1g040201mg [Citrus sinensis]
MQSQGGHNKKINKNPTRPGGFHQMNQSLPTRTPLGSNKITFFCEIIQRTRININNG